MSNVNARVLVSGDFNCGDIEWSSMQLPQRVPKRQTQLYLLYIIKEQCLTQVVDIPTRQDKTLDLLFTNSSSIVKRVTGMPPIGKAHHDIVYIEYDIKALANPASHEHMSVNNLWVNFKSEFTAAMDRFIPSKMTQTKYSLPWIDNSVKRLIRRRAVLKSLATQTFRTFFKRFRAHIQKLIRDAYWKFTQYLHI